MSEDRSHRSPLGSSWAWFFSLALLVILYPLSSGPAFFLLEKAGVDAESGPGLMIQVLYAPLATLCGQSEPTQNLFFEYLKFWIELAHR